MRSNMLSGIVAFAMMIISPALHAQDETKTTDESSETVAKQIEGLIAAHQEKVDAFYKKYRAAATNDEKRAIGETFPDAKEASDAMLLLVAGDLESKEAATAAVWVLRNFRQSPPAALSKILKAQMKLETFGDLALSCMYSKDEEVSSLLERAVEENPHPKARAAAAFASSYSGGDDEEVRNKRRELMKIAIEHGGEVMMGQRSIAERAEASIFEMDHLQIGMVAPDIKGEDLEGVEFALSEYRGKVTVIDFWGDW